MSDDLLVTRKEASEYFGTSQIGMKDLCEAYNLVPKRMRHNGLAKGLDLSDLAVIAKALGKTAPTAEDMRRSLAASA